MESSTFLGSTEVDGYVKNEQHETGNLDQAILRQRSDVSHRPPLTQDPDESYGKGRWVGRLARFALHVASVDRALPHLG